MASQSKNMANPSSNQKGDLLEKKAFEILKLLLENNDFCLPGKQNKIFWKKSYPSKATGSNVIIDISIETYLPNADKFSWLTLFECKNLGRKVGVEDLREFSSKISEIGEHNTKGIFITNNAFQEGAYNFAVSTGIGLVKINSNDKLDWISYRKDEKEKQVIEDNFYSFFTTEETKEENFISYINEKQFYNYADVLLELKIIDFFSFKEKFIDIPYITGKQIDDIIEKIQTYSIYSLGFLDEKKICDFLSEKYSIDFDLSSSLPSEILGKIAFNPLKIFISSTLSKDPHRHRFTLAHEIGHLILHSKYFKNRIAEKEDKEDSLSYKYYVSDLTVRRIEFQANLFAGSLLLPKNLIYDTVNKYFIRRNIRKGHLYWDNQGINQEPVMTLLTEISTTYHVSIETARIRLITMGLLIDDRYKSIRNILKELKFY